MSMNLCKISIYLKKQNIVKHKNLLSRREIGKEIVKFGDIENEKDKLYRHKSPIFLKNRVKNFFKEPKEPKLYWCLV